MRAWARETRKTARANERIACLRHAKKELEEEARQRLEEARDNVKQPRRRYTFTDPASRAVSELVTCRYAAGFPLIPNFFFPNLGLAVAGCGQ